MPSPFPGMDPYLEAPDLWPDLHDALASEIRGELNLALPAPYYARLEMRPEVGIVEDGGNERRQRIVPDAAVVRRPVPGVSGGGVAVLERPGRALDEAVEVTVTDEPIRHHFVEVRDPTKGHQLITLIEIVSPSNKRNGPDRVAYLRKQGEILESEASWLELDLLRGGERLSPAPELAAIVAGFDPSPDYLVTLNRAWRRGGRMAFSLYPFTVRDLLPCVPVPLREGEAEVPLDLQLLMDRAYDRGPYRRGAVDYEEAPSPPLCEDNAAWGAERVAAWLAAGRR